MHGSKITKDPKGCWIWTGATNGKALYGKISVNGSKITGYAHRVAWELYIGPIPDGMEICHNCPGGDNPSCVNPYHSFLGTHKQNFEDAAQKGRMHKGYKLTDEQVLEIYRLRQTMTGKEVAAKFGISMVLVSQIAHKQRYQRLLAQHVMSLPPAIGGQRKNLTNYGKSPLNKQCMSETTDKHRSDG